MSKFVCVRLVQANGLDLALFQFDFDLTFSVFFLNADGTIYGRYGTRDDEDGSRQMSLPGFRKAMEAVLRLHADYPANRSQLSSKRGPPPVVARPEQFESLSNYKSTLDYEGKLVQSCIHCHQVHEAQRLLARKSPSGFTSDEVIFPYPVPDVVGLQFDPQEGATLQEVVPLSLADKAGFRKGDQFVSMKQQPIVSVADVQWVLHGVQAPGRIPTVVRRGGVETKLELELPEQWRRNSDISWRPSTWDLRRIGTGGLRLDTVPVQEREKLGLAPDQMGLRVRHVGQYGAHAVAKKAGFEKSDVIVSFDGKRDLLTESLLLAHVLQRKRAGDVVSVELLRNGIRKTLELPLQ